MLIWLSYVAIPVVLLYFARRRPDLPFPWVFWLFGALIVGCGATHLMEVITTYIPVYRLSGLVKLLTAIVSVGTAIALVPVVPKALLLWSPKDLEREVHERRQAQEVAETQAELLDLAHDGIFVRDLECQITYWNRGAEEMYGWDKAHAVGRKTDQLLRTQLPRPLKEIEEEVYRAGRWDGELVHTRRDGTQLIVESRWAVQRDDQGKPRAILEINRDVTKRKQAEESLLEAHQDLEERVRERTLELSRTSAALRQSRDELEERVRERTSELERSNFELEQFASIASHDLQEPLRKIQTFGGRLHAKCSEALGEQGRDYLSRMLASAARMRMLIHDLLAFSRVATKAQPFVPVSLTSVAHEAVSDLEAQLQETGGRVEVGELPDIEADPSQMRQLLQNLIGNALKYHKAGEPPIVTIEGTTLAEPVPHGSHVATDSAQLCQIVVRDNGIGFEDRYQDRIFQLFQRLHGRNEYEGTGIGLAICKKIVERHGGTITARGTPGVGAVFTILMPTRQNHEEKPTWPSTQNPSPS